MCLLEYAIDSISLFLFEFELYVFEFGLTIFEFGVCLLELGIQPFEFGLHPFEFAPKKVEIFRDVMGLACLQKKIICCLTSH